jgi:hypothetical protein
MCDSLTEEVNLQSACHDVALELRQKILVTQIIRPNHMLVHFFQMREKLICDVFVKI